MTHPDKGTEMFLYELGVDDAARGQGVGKALVAALRDLAEERGCYGMWVLTDADNEAALRTYQASRRLRSRPSGAPRLDLRSVTQSPAQARSHPVEELLLLLVELGLADRAPLAEVVELGDLLGDGGGRPRPASTRSNLRFSFASICLWISFCTADGLRTFEKFCRPISPADSMTRSPEPTIRSKIDWEKNTVFTRSSGISMPCFDSTPCR